jgi:hypothetical protein
MIEKRYRAKLNDKIAALRDSVPSLRVMENACCDDLQGDLQGLTPTYKLNKVFNHSHPQSYILPSPPFSLLPPSLLHDN